MLWLPKGRTSKPMSSCSTWYLKTNMEQGQQTIPHLLASGNTWNSFLTVWQHTGFRARLVRPNLKSQNLKFFCRLHDPCTVARSKTNLEGSPTWNWNRKTGQAPRKAILDPSHIWIYFANACTVNTELWKGKTGVH